MLETIVNTVNDFDIIEIDFGYGKLYKVRLAEDHDKRDWNSFRSYDSAVEFAKTF